MEMKISMYKCSLRKWMNISVAVRKLGLSLPPKKLSRFEGGMEENHMESIRDFVKWYNNDDVILTVETLQKILQSIIRKELA